MVTDGLSNVVGGCNNVLVGTNLKIDDYIGNRNYIVFIGNKIPEKPLNADDQIIINGQNFTNMGKRIQALKEQNKYLKDIVTKLQQRVEILEYMPGGPGYQEALEDFNHHLSTTTITRRRSRCCWWWRW